MRTAFVIATLVLSSLRVPMNAKSALTVALLDRPIHVNQVNQPAQTSTAIFAIIIAAFLSWALYKGLRARACKIQTGREALIGAIGTAVADVSPEGQVRVLSEFWQARAETGVIRKSARIVVVNMDGLVLVVKPVEEKA